MFARIKNNTKVILAKKGIHLYHTGVSQFFTYHTRPKNSKNIESKSYGDDDVAIVIQGPIRYEDDFTVETVKIYKKIYPNSLIIVSTWNTEKSDVLELIRKAGATVCLSDYSEVATGLGNSINLQLATTKKGISIAKENGAKYCVKTRTDQRIYNSLSFTYCKELIHRFPLKAGDIDAHGRIITSSLDTFSNRYYNLSDLFLFGYISDIEKYFSCPFDTRAKIHALTDDQWEFSLLKTGEIWFSTHYLEKIGHTLKWTPEDSYFAMANYFVVIDAESIDLFWPKYSNSEYMWRSYDENPVLKQVTFMDWLILEDKYSRGLN